eukprot:355187-Chlamydomonas_euryale.AAC.2
MVSTSSMHLLSCNVDWGGVLAMKYCSLRWYAWNDKELEVGCFTYCMQASGALRYVYAPCRVCTALPTPTLRLGMNAALRTCMPQSGCVHHNVRSGTD